MTNRVCLGAKGTSYGLWVSKPGYDVLTTSDDHLLFSSARRTMQVIESGSASYPAEALVDANAFKTITHANYGFRPFVVLKFPGFADSYYMYYPIDAFTYYTIERTNTSFVFWRPRIPTNNDTQYVAFTVEYFLLSFGYGNM